jgi:hypothetical protein
MNTKMKISKCQYARAIIGDYLFLVFVYGTWCEPIFIEAQVYNEKVEFGDGYWIEHKNEEKSNLICEAQNMAYF